MNQGLLHNWTPEENAAHLADVRAILHKAEPGAVLVAKAERQREYRKKLPKPLAQPDHRICSGPCGRELPLTDFEMTKASARKKPWRRSTCPACMLAYYKARYEQKKKERAP